MIRFIRPQTGEVVFTHHSLDKFRVNFGQEAYYSMIRYGRAEVCVITKTDSLRLIAINIYGAQQ